MHIEALPQAFVCALLLSASASISAQAPARTSTGHPVAPRDTPLSPAEASRSFSVPDDLEIEQVLADPVVRQPVFLNFD